MHHLVEPFDSPGDPWKIQRTLHNQQNKKTVLRYPSLVWKNSRNKLIHSVSVIVKTYDIRQTIFANLTYSIEKINRKGAKTIPIIRNISLILFIPLLQNKIQKKAIT